MANASEREKNFRGVDNFESSMIHHSPDWHTRQEPNNQLRGGNGLPLQIGVVMFACGKSAFRFQIRVNKQRQSTEEAHEVSTYDDSSERFGRID
jgi:hypothetical protein